MNNAAAFGWAHWAATAGFLLATGGCGSTTTSPSGDGGAPDTTTNAASCTTDSQCAARLPTTTPPGCATATCDPLSSTCRFAAKDEDGDGHAAFACSAPGVMIATGDDCNDHDANLYPGHPQPCHTAPDGGAAPMGLCAAHILCESDGSESKCTATATCSANETCDDGTCKNAASCTIGGTLVVPGSTNTSNPCQLCDPSESTVAWSNEPDGTACGSGSVCAHGVCGSQCDIGDAGVVASGALNPANACQSCQPGKSPTSWTNVPTGTSCGMNEVCNGSTCSAGCSIGGVVYSPGELNPADPCQDCEVAMDPTGWTNLADGTTCGSGQVCSGGQCGTQCSISGTGVVASGTVNPSNPCQSCQPGTTTMAWTNLPLGTGCGTGEVCNGSACTSGCFNAGTIDTPSEVNPLNPCQVCDPSVSTTTWSPNAAVNGNGCGTGEVCNAGACASGCWIGGAFYAAGDTSSNPNGCVACVPATSTTSWTNLSGTSCGSGGTCGGGTCNVSFAYSGAAQGFVVPSGITHVVITAEGAAGFAGTSTAAAAGGASGLGGSATGTITVTAAETLTITVGGAGSNPAGGFNGGAAGGGVGGAGGGGASDIRIGGTALANRVLVAGGGGGGGGAFNSLDCTGGEGAGGGGNGGMQGGGGGAGSTHDSNFGEGGSDGTLTYGGPGGCSVDSTNCGVAGSSGPGGAGGVGDTGDPGGGGGGGGFYGGGGGGGTAPAPPLVPGGAGGGGGGSSYAAASVSTPAYTLGVRSGNGQVTVSY